MKGTRNKEYSILKIQGPGPYRPFNSSPCGVLGGLPIWFLTMSKLKNSSENTRIVTEPGGAGGMRAGPRLRASSVSIW